MKEQNIMLFDPEEWDEMIKLPEEDFQNKMEGSESRLPYKVMATKISPEAAVHFEALCQRIGVRPYRLVQSVISSALRFMDDVHQLDYDLERLMLMFFSNIKDIENGYNLADFNTRQRITESILFIGDEKNPVGYQSVMVEEPFMGDAQCDWNVMHQLEAFVCKVMPEWYRRLRQLGVELGTSNIYETIQRLIADALKVDRDAETLRELFRDNDRSDYGVKPVDAPYKRHPVKTIK